MSEEIQNRSSAETQRAACAIWRIAALRLREKSVSLYRSWITKIVPLALEGTVVRLGVEDDFFLRFLMDAYGDLFEEVLRGIDGVDYSCRMEDGHPASEVPAGVYDEASDEAKTAAPQRSPQKCEAPACVQAPPQRDVAPAQSAVDAGNADYTFENFVVGDGNRHSFSAARAVAAEPGRHHNPLFLYGTNGVGKTHLLQAVANEIRRTNPKLKVRDISCAEMLDDFYEMMRQNRLAAFRASFRDVDVLLIDDVHGLAKKPVIQEDIFNIFNTLYRKRKQIILTSDRQPCELSGIDKRLTGRFEAGLLSEVGMPEFEARLAMLRMWREKLLSADPLPDRFLEFLAENISSSVRRLRSAFNTLAYYSSLSGGYELTIELAEELLHEQLMEESAARTVSMETIQSVVAAYFNISVGDLLGNRRTRNLAVPRMFAMSLCRRLTAKSTTEVGEAFRRTHATVLHAEKQVEELCRKDDAQRLALLQLERQLQKH